MSRYANSFGMNVLGYDPLLASWPDGIEKLDLDPLLGNSDFISIHVPLNKDTRGLIGIREFELVKPGAIFVNTSRGEVIDEEALRLALLDGRIGAAGLDVLAGEPDIDRHRLVEYAREHDNLIITPHIGGFAPEAFKYLLSFTCNRIVDFFK
jgi:D-3-phosphoglycerate dehydrogenase